MSERVSSELRGSLSRQGRDERLSIGRQGFAARRRSKRRYALIALILFILIIIGGLIWGLQQSSVRIAHVEVFGSPSLRSYGEANADQSLANIALAAMQGTYFGIIPRDSIFFFPASRIRADILAAHSDIAAVSIFRNGLTGISIKMNDRVPITRWCGLSPTPDVEPYCYVFDASGYIFAAAAASGTQTVNAFTLYAPLAGDTLEPLGASIAYAEKLPRAFDFARQLDTLGSPATHIILQGDEVNDYLASGTRISYVLGHENDAYTALVSARDTFNLADGSVDYVDLRFDGKVYVKKVEPRK